MDTCNIPAVVVGLIDAYALPYVRWLRNPLADSAQRTTATTEHYASDKDDASAALVCRLCGVRIRNVSGDKCTFTYEDVQVVVK